MLQCTTRYLNLSTDRKSFPWMIYVSTWGEWRIDLDSAIWWGKMERTNLYFKVFDLRFWSPKNSFDLWTMDGRFHIILVKTVTNQPFPHREFKKERKFYRFFFHLYYQKMKRCVESWRNRIFIKPQLCQAPSGISFWGGGYSRGNPQWA